jgi:hypothetical protein
MHSFKLVRLEMASEELVGECYLEHIRFEMPVRQLGVMLKKPSSTLFRSLAENVKLGRLQ